MNQKTDTERTKNCINIRKTNLNTHNIKVDILNDSSVQ